MGSQTSFDFETEAQKAQKYLGWVETNMEALLDEARRIARHHCHNPELGKMKYGVPHTVTSDHVRDKMFIEPRVDGKNNWMGTVFRKGFVRVGFVSSKAEGSHGTIRRLWTLPKYFDYVKRFQAGII